MFAPASRWKSIAWVVDPKDHTLHMYCILPAPLVCCFFLGDVKVDSKYVFWVGIIVEMLDSDAFTPQSTDDAHGLNSCPLTSICDCSPPTVRGL